MILVTMMRAAIARVSGAPALSIHPALAQAAQSGRCLCAAAEERAALQISRRAAAATQPSLT